MSVTRPAVEADFEIFDSLRERTCPAGLYVGDGIRVVRRMLAEGRVERILCLESWLGRLPLPEGVEICLGTREQMDRLVGFRLHQGIMALGIVPEPRPLRGTLHVALDDVSNAENVGAILRTCAAFGVDGVLVGPTTASPWLRRAVRVSMAAGLRIPVHPTPDLPAALRTMNAWAAHIHGEKRDYLSLDYREPVCLVLGGEDRGPRPEVLEACRGCVYIPMADGWDCLNVAASTAVLLAEVQRQRRSTK